ncbi:hypothetical protein TNCV_4567771 [Trichonephila clavipes]|nr:hypothetical protein TNCV_4567771 [Trichonephila clavipes]
MSQKTAPTCHNDMPFSVREREYKHFVVGEMHEKILFLTKRDYVRPFRREKRHDNLSSPRRNISVQNSQPCGCFEDNYV